MSGYSEQGKANFVDEP